MKKTSLAEWGRRTAKRRKLKRLPRWLERRLMWSRAYWYYQHGNLRMLARLVNLWVLKNSATACHDQCPECSGSKMADVIYYPDTAYHWDYQGIDPNGPMLCCKDFAGMQQEYWDEMWREYNSGRL